MYRVRTSIDDSIIANLLAHRLVSNHVAASVHIREINSVYAWNKKIEDVTEYEVEALCSSVEPCIEVIKANHPYECPEILYEQINCSNQLKDWCDEWCFENKN